jgi:DNA helicase HerA-like ATPase
MTTHIGIVSADVEPPNTTYCWVSLIDSSAVKKDGFVIIEDAKRRFKLVGQVIDIMNKVEILTASSREQILRRGRKAEDIIKEAFNRPDFFKVYAKVKLLYKVENGGRISAVDTSPTDTSPVFLGDGQTLAEVLGFSKEPRKSVCLGFLYAHPEVSVCLDLNEMLAHHIAIFGQTNSGKSYATGVIIEEAVSKGVPVVVFDHLGEYLSMAEAVDGGKGLDIIRVAPRDDLFIDFEDVMKAPQILTTLGVTDAQLNLLRDAYSEAKDHGLKGLGAVKWLLSDEKTQKGQKGVKKRLYLIGRSRGYSTATVDGLRWKLEALLSTGIFGDKLNVSGLVSPGRLTVVDLSATDIPINSLVIGTLLYKLLEARKNNEIPPVVVVIEEAHNYITRDETPSSAVVRSLIRQARHWGIGVVLVSQRPAGLHTDALNIVNTHIVFRLKGTDLEYIKQFAPFTREELEDIQVLPKGVAYITSPAIRGGINIKVAIRRRRTVHGGATVEFVK